MKSIIDDITDIGARLRELEGKPLESKFKCRRCKDTGRSKITEWRGHDVFGPCPDCAMEVEAIPPAPAKRGKTIKELLLDAAQAPPVPSPSHAICSSCLGCGHDPNGNVCWRCHGKGAVDTSPNQFPGRCPRCGSHDTVYDPGVGPYCNYCGNGRS